jgi:hypothetical protein
MRKLLRDGNVAVLVSAGFGAGWYSWHGIKELLFDPDIVKMIELDWPNERILAHCEKFYGDDHYFGGVEGLSICWVPEGAKFRIDEYDGAETLVTQDQDEWIIA